jgi:hypothetical protein
MSLMVLSIENPYELTPALNELLRGQTELTVPVVREFAGLHESGLSLGHLHRSWIVDLQRFVGLPCPKSLILPC